MNVIFRVFRRIYNSIFYWIYRQKIKKLIKNGLTLGKNVTIRENVSIDSTYAYLIKIGNNCSIANGVLILAHDGTTTKYNGGYEKIAKVVIKDNCHIGRNAIILPGITIGPNVSIAAGSFVNKNIPPNSLVAGVPARIYGKFDDLINRDIEKIKNQTVHFERKNLLKANNKTKKEILNYLDNEPLFVFIGDEKNPFTFT